MSTTKRPPMRERKGGAGENQGVFRKFKVTRTDGSSARGGKHHGCEYFVLDVDHDPHARAALITYANACEATHPLLAMDMRLRYDLADKPIDMVLFCPACGLQHIDRRDPPMSAEWDDAEAWTNPPHRSHLCHGCGHVWRPADVPTNGVKAIRTKGTKDSPPVLPHEELARSAKANGNAALNEAIKIVDRMCGCGKTAPKCEGWVRDRVVQDGERMIEMITALKAPE